MPNHVLGVVLDTTHVTLVRLTGSAKSYEISLALQQQFPHHPEPEEELLLRHQMLHELIDPMHLRGDTILAAVPAANGVLRTLDFPFTDQRRIRQTLKFALDEHMPFEPEDVLVDGYPLPTANTKHARLLTVGMPAKVVAASLHMLHEVGLEPSVVDLDIFGLANAAAFGYKALPARVLALDVSLERTLLVVLEHGRFVSARSLAYGVPQDDTPLENWASRVSKHLQHTLYVYNHTAQDSYDPDLVLVSGAPSEHLEAIVAALQGHLSVPVGLWQLTASAYKPDTTRTALDLARYAVPFGLALRGLQTRAYGVNLRQEQFALHRESKALRGRLLAAGILTAVVLGLGVCVLSLENYYKEQRYTALQNEINKTFKSILPDARLVNPTVQLREKIRELEERMKAFGGVSGAQLSGLQILQEISARTPASITLNVDNLAITTGATDLSGTTGSYDDVVKLKSALEESSFFPSVKINNTRADVDNKIAFRLTVNTAKTAGNTP